MNLEKLERKMPPRVQTYLTRRRWTRLLLEDPRWVLYKREQTIPPEGERVTFHAIWAVEVYTPASAERLFKRLEALGFGRRNAWRRDGMGAQLERLRAMPSGGTWMNLELIVPPGAPGFRVDTVEMPLPSGVRVARPTIMSLTSSVTVLVVQFVLNDEAATAFDALSRETDFLPEIRSDDTGFTSTSPDQTKQKALRALRAELRGRCADWLADQLPGAFASRRLGRAPMPTAELVTTEIAVPFAQGDHGSYIDFADFGYDPFHWESDDMPNWRLVFDRDDDFAVVAARSAEAFDDENFKPHGDDLRWPMAYHAHEYLDRDIALWAASKLLFAFHARLGEIRDHGIQHRRLERASKRLSVVRDEFLRDALDARVVAAELERYADDERRFEWNACDWKTSEDLRREEPERLLGNLRFMMSESAAALTAAETRLRDGLSVDSAVIGARATLRLTWWVLLIGLAALLVALGSLFIALRTTNDTGTTPAPATTTVTVTRPATPTATPRAQPARPRSSP